MVTAGDRTLLNYSGIVKRLPRSEGTPRTQAPT